MFNPTRQLIVDRKVQDRLREWFSRRGTEESLNLKCLALGDSDVDYSLSYKNQDIRVLNAPYNVERIKYHLIFSGNATNLTGSLTCFRRYVNTDGTISSMYSYFPSPIFSQGIVPPSLGNGQNTSSINFASLNPEGFILFFQTLPDNYLDVNGIPQRLVEGYSITITPSVIANYEFTLDEANGSLLVAHDTLVVVPGFNVATIAVKGLLSGLSKSVTFNY